MQTHQVLWCGHRNQTLNDKENNLFTTTTEAIGRALGTIASTARKTTMQVTQSVLIDVDQSMRLTTTDLETINTTVVTGDHKGAPWSVVLDVKRLKDLLKASPRGGVSMRVNSQLKVSIKTDAGKFTISGTSPDDYPPTTIVGDRESCAVDGLALSAALSAALSCVKRDGTGEALEGVLMTVADGDLTVVGIDGHRGAIATVPCNGADGRRALVPHSAITDVVKGGHAGKVKIGFGDSTVRFDFEGDTALTVSTLAADYPDYMQIVPQRTKQIVTVQSSEVRSAMAMISSLSDLGSPGVVISMGDDGVTASVESADAGGTCEIRCDTDLGAGPLKIGIAHSLLADVARACGDEMAMYFGGDLNPVRVESDGIVFLIMPMRLK